MTAVNIAPRSPRQGLRTDAARTPLVLLAAALLLGACLRLSGIAWGLPDKIHSTYSYHPDEAALLGWASDLYRGMIVSKQFMYGGTFYFSVLEASTRVAAALSVDAQPSMRTQIEFARYGSALCALATLLVTYWAGATLYSRRVGALAAMVLAIAPGHVIAAQVARPDALFTLAMSANLLFAARIARGRGDARLNLIAGGAVLGLAIATRFPAAVWWLGYLCALIIAAHLRAEPRAALLASLARLSGVALCAYAIASPHSLRYLPVLLDGLRVQLGYQSTAFVDAAGHGPGWWQYGGAIMAQAIGYGLYVPALAAVAYACRQHRQSDLLVAAFVLPYFALLSSTSWVVVRYFVPLLPLLAIWLGQLAEAGICALSAPPRIVAGATVAAAMAVNLLALGTYSAALRDADVRDQTLAWLVNQVPAKTRIGVLQGFDGDVFSHPPAIGHFDWTACPLSICDLTQFLVQPLDIVIVADTYLQRPAIVGTGPPSTVSAVFAEQSIYLPRKRFAPRWSRFGVDVAIQFSAYDLRAALPTLTLYWR